MIGASEERAIKATLDGQDVVGNHSRVLDVAGLVARKSAIDTIRGLQETSEIQRILEDIKRHEAVMRTLVGPIEDLRRAGLFQHASFLSVEMKLVRRTMADWDADCRLPVIAETARFMMESRDCPASEALKRYAEEALSVTHVIEGMRKGSAALEGICRALRNMPSFGDHLGSALRADLGDWRDEITWPTEIFTDLVARSDFYVGLGFDTALTDFPSPAFDESLEIAGLRTEPPPLVKFYGSPIPFFNEDEEEKLARTNMAHDWLLRFETQVRRFIDHEMTKAFGPDWPKRRLPNGLYEQWQEKKQKARDSGGKEWCLIAYADFTDYMPIICNRGNWGVFARFFGRQEYVREAFQRLHPIRLDTMHARPITQDDELLLYVEVRRLMNVITKKNL